MDRITSLYEKATGSKVTSILPLTTGISNKNYLINGVSVMRIKSLFRDPYYSAKAEHDVEMLIAPLHIAPELLYFNERNGTKITRYIDDAYFLDVYPSNEQLVLVAATLKKLHGAALKIRAKFSMFDRLDTYKNDAFERINPTLESAIIAEAKKYFDGKHQVLCHNDVVNGNLLFYENRVSLIDYEYASMNDPVFDLVSFLSENDITDERRIHFFLMNYYGEESAIPYKKIMAFYRFLDLLWFY
ncbi:MAG: phosphotransferase family protein [Firmicutes bacterium]|nr:phosphotransferase family protein [Bacillota bacterium]